MNRPAFITALKNSLRDDLNVGLLNDDAYDQFVSDGVRAYSRFKPMRERASVALVADQAEYDSLPADLVEFVESEWGASRREYAASTHPLPWEDAHVERDLPRFRVKAGKIYLDPAPDSADIASYGATYDYWYDAAHTVDADSTTIPTFDDPVALLFMRWAAYAELEGRPDQAESFTARYRMLAGQVWDKALKMIEPLPAIVRG